MDNPITRLFPETTHPTLKGLLLFLGVGSILCGIFFRTLTPLLALSFNPSYESLWQLFTYPFAASSPLSWWSLLFLSFELFCLWIYSAPIIDKVGIKSYFFLYLGASCFTGLAALGVMTAVSFFMTGLTPVLFAIMTAWMLMYPRAIFSFFDIAFKADRLLLSFLILDLLIHFAHEEWVPLAANSSGALFGYLYCKLPTLELFKKKRRSHSKIYDFQSGRPLLEDEKFMDEMLARISLHGEGTLTETEKKRMRKISEKRF